MNILPDSKIPDVVVFGLDTSLDVRGCTKELWREDWTDGESGLYVPLDYKPAMAYFSTTNPGQKRGPHEHKYQTDYFVFLVGQFAVYLWDTRAESPVDTFEVLLFGGRRQGIVIPPRVVHGYRCVGPEIGLLINLPNKLYRGADRREEVDEIRHEDDPKSMYQIPTLYELF